MNELERKMRRSRKELANAAEKQENEPEAAKDTTARLEGAVRGYRTSQSATRGTAERGTSSSSKRSRRSEDSLEVRSSTPKREKG